MSKPDSTDRAYMLADEWIHTILSTKPEVLVRSLESSVTKGDGRPPVPNTVGATNLAKTLADFRAQLALALSDQHHPDYDQLND
ncbi:hypothetical protein HS961_09140 [Comamonas piscis]|uniref:Uncharacterized protein n=1 Tax=Comamonas piscis TaxID=1562974 RepID=A0A7G5EG66_9BURK|nr:hypothetical protein [Comamonas piscis]QMV72991.1 hypothetical protein HS961_09140 [Comamonas piscis]WSO35774.1 hypothetical protein VUJ63_09165 [Comamonas piscis]